MTQKDFAVGMACGVAVGMTFGLLVGMLFAPANGAETRRRLRYEREHVAGAARTRVRRTMERLHLAQPEMTEGAEEGDGEEGDENFFGV